MTAWWYWLAFYAAVGICWGVAWLDRRCRELRKRRLAWDARQYELRAQAQARLVEDILWLTRRREEVELAAVLRAHRLATSEPVPLRLIHTAVSEL